MATVTIRNLSKTTHQALKARAIQHGRSLEAEIRHILDATVTPASRVKIGSAISALSRNAGLSDDDLEGLILRRDRKAAEPIGL
ncbi:Plasmid stability protein [Friedmanniomyces endolithicus]|nr:Plasmid stability protein [Friedmanniomyces endolithicus]